MMKCCFYCRKTKKTSLPTVNNTFICESCIISKNYEPCTNCGKYFKRGSSNGSSCTSCEEKGLD